MTLLKIIVFVGILCAFAENLRGATVSDMRCEDRLNPLGLDEAHPQLGWLIDSEIRGERQTAYQILVASTAELLSKNQGDLWNSGKVVSDETVHVAYAGKKLNSRATCFWKVRVWDKSGKVSDWSPSASWTMGLLRPEDWSAQWITASKWFMPPGLRPPGLIVTPDGWADVDLGAAYPVDAIRLYFADTNTAAVRFKVLGADNLQFGNPQVLVDQTANDYKIDAAGWQEFPVSGIKASHVRLWLTGGSAKGKVTVRQMEVISGGTNVALMRPTREFGTQWHEGHAPFLVDGMPSANEGDQVPPDACPLPTAPLLRKSFAVQQTVKHATLYVAALGMADVTINGQAVTDDVLGPPFTDYTKRVVYMTRDVTGLLTNVENAIGVTIGNGFFSTPGRGFGERHNGDGPPRVLVQTEIEFADGTHQVVNSDESWKWSRSEIAYNDTFGKYMENRALSKPGWDHPGYDDSIWPHVSTTAALGGKLCAPMGPPIRVIGELKPDRVEGNHAYFKNLSAGWPQVKVNGKANQTITLISHAPGYNAPPLTFVLATNGAAVLQPRFMYLSGPLDLEVKGLTEPLSADDVKILLVHADLKSAGSFECSNPFLNQIHEVLLRTHRNYDGDQPMDPMREKQGWTQDMQGMFESAAYLTDVSGIYRKWWHDFGDAQDDSGYLGSVIPMVGRQVNDWNSPWWDGVVVLLPWQHYQFYGDRRMLAESYDTMRRYVDFLGKLTASGSVRGWGDYPYLNNGNTNSAEAKELMLSWLGAGDWQSPIEGREGVTAVLLDMPAWSYYATFISQSAALLGKKNDAAKYSALAKQIKDRYNAKLLNPETGLYGKNLASQAPQALALGLDVVPPAQRELTHQRLLDAIHSRNDHLGVGFVGLPFLFHDLIDFNDTALGNKIVNQQTFPGWKTLIHDGVLGEDWHGGGAQMPSCGGAVGLWLYQSVLGIRPDPAGPGFKKFIIAPQPDPATGLNWAHGSYDSIHGKILCNWKIDAGYFILNTTIPANTSATIYLPTTDATSVTESGKKAAEATGVKFLRADANRTIYEIGSGTYHFMARFSQKN